MKAICLLLCLALAQGHIFREKQWRSRTPENSRMVDTERVPYNTESLEQQHRSQQQKNARQNVVFVKNWDRTPDMVSQMKSQQTQQQVPEWYGMDYIDPSKYAVKNPADRTVLRPIHTSSQIRYAENQELPELRVPEELDEASRQMWNSKQRYPITQRQVQVPLESGMLSVVKKLPIHNSQVPVQVSTSDESSWESIIEKSLPVFTDESQPMDTHLYSNKFDMLPTYEGHSSIPRSINMIDETPRSVDPMKAEIDKIFNDAHETMHHVSNEDKIAFHQAYEQAAKDLSEDALLNATQLLNKYQYPVETHIVKTEDGYFLTLFRILPKDQSQTRLVPRPVVFLMHGLLGSADDWLLMGPGKSLAYMLSDAGYDVWLGNARGSKYSRRHVSKHPSQPDFWQYSTDEIALYDLPTLIDYTLKTSQQERLYYVGYSQGTTAFFALAATRPEYNNKIITMYALSPMVYMSQVRSPLFRMIASNSPFYNRLLQQLGRGEFKPSQHFVHSVGGSMCEKEIGCKKICSNVIFVMAGVNVENVDVEHIPKIISHLPAGGSTRQMVQYAQGVTSNDFTRYDYGSPLINEQVYGSADAPKYDMTKVQVPVVLYYSEEDWLAHPRDVERLAKELPNVKDLYKVADQHFANMDFQFSKIAPQVIYNRLIESIRTTQKNYVY